jgi:hypothetical protein
MRGRGVIAGLLAVCGAVALSGPARADQFDSVMQLDNMGVSYDPRRREPRGRLPLDYDGSTPQAGLPVSEMPHLDADQGYRVAPQP